MYAGLAILVVDCGLVRCGWFSGLDVLILRVCWYNTGSC